MTRDQNERLAKYRQQQRAYAAVRRAIKRGILTRQPCMWCGAKAEAHHQDYDHPLEVMWLCHSCHFLLHDGHKGPTYKPKYQREWTREDYAAAIAVAFAELIQLPN
jgi:hypothetical protein